MEDVHDLPTTSLDELRHLKEFEKRFYEKFGFSPSDAQRSKFFDRMALQIGNEVIAETGAPLRNFETIINASAAIEDDAWIIEQMIRPGSNSIWVAPKNSGGSTGLLNLHRSMLYRTPFLGAFRTNLPDAQQLITVWINPEEAVGTPRYRLDKMGVDRIEDNFIEVYTRDQRMYLNVARDVDQLSEALAPMIDPDAFVVLTVDGMTGTIKGDAWNTDLEAWKGGIGQLMTNIGSQVAMVRAQVTSDSARQARKYGAKIELEDAVGGQIGDWPDQRFIYSYPRKDAPKTDGKGTKRVVDLDRRLLQVRGRLVDELEVIVGYNEGNDHLTMITGETELLAVLELNQLAADQGFLDAYGANEVNPTANSIADWLADRSRSTDDESKSPSSYRRAIQRVGIDQLLTSLEEAVSNRVGEQQ